MPTTPPPSRALDCLLNPRSIVVVGASDDPSRIGGRPIRFLQQLGYRGRIHAVNPNRTTVQGLPAFPSIDALDEEIDLAIIATPAAAVADALAAAARKGAGGAVIFSSGFAEVGPEGAALQAALLKVRDDTNLRILGPNALGLYSAPARVAATFSSFLEKGAPPEGPVALISQSGAFGAHMAVLASERGIGLRHWITTGNEVDLSTTDCIDALKDDDGVSVLAVYVEGVRDGRAFMGAISAARAAGKRVVVMKVGRTPSGTIAAQSHTASLAGDDAVFEAALEHAGAERALRADTFLDVVYALSRGGPMRGNTLGILTVSGGAGVLMADAASDAGFVLPAMPQASQKRLRDLCPFGSPTNPLDVTAHAMNDMGLVVEHLRQMFAAGGFDAVAGFFMNWPKAPFLAERLNQALRDGCAGFEDRLFTLVANTDDTARAAFEAGGALVFQDPTSAIDALAALRRQSAPHAAIAAPTAPSDGIAFPAELDEHGAMVRLIEHGIAFPDVRRASTPEAAGEAAMHLGVPVALKILSPDLPHKSDVGGVMLGLSGQADVTRAARAMARGVTDAVPSARQTGFLVVPMVCGVAECIVGARVDAAFGPVVMVGLGGVFTEVFGDTAIRIAPVDEAAACTMLQSLRAWPILDGARGRPKADVAALAQTIAALSRFAFDNAQVLQSVELNPVAVFALGEGVVALDAVIVPRLAS